MDVEKKNKYLARWALYLGIMSLYLSFFVWGFFIFVVAFVCLTLITGIRALYNLKKNPGKTMDKVFAWIGIILAIVSAILATLFMFAPYF